MAKYYVPFVNLNTFIYEPVGIEPNYYYPSDFTDKPPDALSPWTLDRDEIIDLEALRTEEISVFSNPIFLNTFGAGKIVYGVPPDGIDYSDQNAEITYYKNYIFFNGLSIDLPSTASFFTVLNLKRNGPYGFPTWKQIRISENPLTRNQRKRNILTINTGNNGDIIEVYKEPVFSSRGKPLTMYFVGVEGPSTELQVIREEKQLNITQNIKCFESDRLNRLYGYWQNIDTLKTNDGYKENSINDFNNKREETIIPLERFEYSHTIFPQKGSLQFDERLRTNFYHPWKDDREERKVPFATNNIGLVTVEELYVYYNNFMESNLITRSRWPLDPGISFLTTNSQKINDHDVSIESVADFRGILQNTMKFELDLQTKSRTWPFFDYFTPLPRFSYNHTITPLTSCVNPHGMDIEGVNSGSLFNDLSINHIPSGEANWDAGEQNGTNPFYDSYSEFMEDIKRVGKDYAFVPEFRSSLFFNDLQATPNITPKGFLEVLGGKILDKTKEIGMSIGRINHLGTTEIGHVSASSNDSDFYQVYSHSDFMSNFDVALELSDRHNKPIYNMSLTCKGIKKFTPYEGFYPAERTVQIANKFRDSIIDNCYYTGSGAGNNVGDILTTDVDRYVYFNNIMTPMFAPGIMFNSIKSGLAVSYPIHTSSLTLENGGIHPLEVHASASLTVVNSDDFNADGDKLYLYFRKNTEFVVTFTSASSGITDTSFSSGEANVNVYESSSADVASHLRTLFNSISNYSSAGSAETAGILADNYGSQYDVHLQFVADSAPYAISVPTTGMRPGTDSNYLIKKRFDYKVPFEALLEPNLYLTNKEIHCSEPHPSGNLSGSAKWNGTGDTTEYQLMTHNFLAETANFFLQDSNFSFISSKKSSETNLNLVSGSTYILKVSLYKSQNISNDNQEFLFENEILSLGSTNMTGSGVQETFTMYSRPSAFGPPSKIDASRIPGPYISDSIRGVNYPFTPAYYDGKSYFILSYKAFETRRHTIEELFQNFASSVAELNDKTAKIQFRHSFEKEAPIPIENLRSLVLMDYGVSDAPINGENSISINHFGDSINLNLGFIKEVDLLDDDSSDVVKVAVDISSNQDAQLIIQPKWETPMFNFQSYGDSDTINLPLVGSQSVPRGIWHQYGQIETDPNKGIFMQVEGVNPGSNNFETADAIDLAPLLGLSTEPVKLGKTASKKVVREAIVAVPFFEYRTGTKYVEEERKFLKISRDHINAALEGRALPNVNEMVQKMQRFVMPPLFNFLEDETIDPMTMYIFDFKHTFDQEDLAAIWQNLPPKLMTEFKTEEITISHNLNVDEEIMNLGYATMGENITPDEVLKRMKWMVFKVKQKAEQNYYDKIVGETQKLVKTSPYSHNWPYDYFSLVELAKIETTVGFGRPIPVLEQIPQVKIFNPFQSTIPSTIPEPVIPVIATPNNIGNLSQTPTNPFTQIPQSNNQNQISVSSIGLGASPTSGGSSIAGPSFGNATSSGAATIARSGIQNTTTLSAGSQNTSSSSMYQTAPLVVQEDEVREQETPREQATKQEMLEKAKQKIEKLKQKNKGKR